MRVKIFENMQVSGSRYCPMWSVIQTVVGRPKGTEAERFEAQSLIIFTLLVNGINITDDEEAGCYNITLSNEVINILSAGVAYYWLSAKILNSENLRNYMSTKDYSYFSPANLLREMNTLKDNVYKDYQRLLTMHTYYKGNIKMPEK